MKKKLYSQKWFVALMSVFYCFLLGSAFPAIKLSFEKLQVTDAFQMIQLAGFRFLIAGVLVMLFLGLIMKIPLWPRKNEWIVVLIIAFLQTYGSYALYYIGMSNTTAVKSSVLSSSEIFFTVILSHLFLQNDKINLKKLIGLLLGITGIVTANMMHMDGVSWSFTLWGDGLVIFTSVTVAAAYIYSKKKCNEIDVSRVNAWQLLLGGIMLLFTGFGGNFKMLPYTMETVWPVAYLGVISAAAFSIWFLLLKHNKASDVVIYKFWMPVFGTLLSVLLLKEETLSWEIMAGLLLVTADIAVTNLPDKKIVGDIGGPCAFK